MQMQKRPLPEPGPGQILIRTRAAGVCGSDLHIFLGRFAPARPPLILGHEACGVVTTLGPGAGDFKAGDRVLINPNFSCGSCLYCREGHPHQCLERETLGMTAGRDGAFAEYFLAPARNALPLPDSVEWEQAALVDPLACAVHALNLVPPARETVAIFGAGPSGLCFLQLSRLRGATNIIVVDPLQARRAAARRLGANHTLNPEEVSVPQAVRTLTEGLGVHLAIEASGSPAAVSSSIQATRNRGSVLIYGVYSSPVDGVDFQDQHRREITIYGASGAPESFPTALDLIASGRVDVGPLISHRLHLEELASFFQDGIIQDRKQNYLKAVVLL